MANTEVPLSQSTVDYLNPAVPRPSYDRAAVTVGIVHFGVGGFHRAHQALYTDALMNQGEALDWGICGVGVMPADLPRKEALDAQDGLYTVVIKQADGTLEPRVVGSLVRYLYAPNDPEALLAVLADPQTRIVSLTITEGGYNLNQVTGEFDTHNPLIQRDAQGDAPPVTVFRFVVQALQQRRSTTTAPFTVMSCDNLPGNGDLARAMFAAYGDLIDPELGDWIRTSVAFPNSMVDRITPVTTEEDRADMLIHFGVVDRWPVVCEAFTQWVLQDDFPTGRPAWEHTGVQIVAEVQPYELMKLRLLNASHQALCYLGYLSGYRYAHQVAADPVFSEFLLGYMDEEGGPTVPPVPGVDLGAYKATLLERFANPEIRDTLARLCADSSDRIPKWLLPVIRANLSTGGQILRSALVVAAWARYAEGVDERGAAIDVVDQRRDDLMARAVEHGQNPLTFIQNESLFGDLATNPAFAQAYLHSLQSLHQIGAAQTVRALNAALRTEAEAAEEGHQLVPGRER